MQWLGPILYPSSVALCARVEIKQSNKWNLGRKDTKLTGMGKEVGVMGNASLLGYT